ncbi:GNAT family N-acetyltransferase [Actinomadura violacea]|uniref:GNAT family N-acetyltransferase n=1 Tax=Actinomadura violacea TaxID=2819934 RepID=A0ABS3S8P3_9ACTN|nr:GNAT family N-acetyltransferase [Actinomadura violacea]MBO2465123.1 GNAT family N-acetyltransferase [Actinomadura violacea]
MELSTPRLWLREFGASDHAAVHAFAGDPEVTRYTDWGPNSPSDTTTFLAEVTQDATSTPRHRFALAVVDRRHNALIGSIELRVTSTFHRRAEIGYVLHRAWWGNGYGSEAATALLRFGFDELGLHKISATCDPGNAASARVLTKIGMQREGRLRDHLHIRGRWQDRLLFAALSPSLSTETAK